MLNTCESPIPGQIIHNDELEGRGGSINTDATTADPYANMVPLIVDIPLQSLQSLTAFGNMNLEGTKVIGFAPEAVGVLKELFGKTYY